MVGASTDEGSFVAAIHERLLDRDPTAPAELVERYLVPLVRRLRRRQPEVHDDTLLDDAVTDALLDYIEHPDRYDPSKRVLLGYLTMAANGDLLNALEKERRRRRRESSLDRVEETRGDRNETIADTNAAAEMERVEQDRARVAAMEEAVRSVVPDPRDRRLMRLMLEGERTTAVYARVLGIEHQDRTLQTRDVKRHKDRLKKRLARLGARLHERAD